MIDSHKIDYSKLDTLNVSRETFHELDEFREMILDENKKINLISQHTVELARDRHIIDCAQIIDLINENHLSCTDLGSGSGCLLYTSPSPRDLRASRMPSSA